MKKLQVALLALVVILLSCAYMYLIVAQLDAPVAYYSHSTKECAYVEVPDKEAGQLVKESCDKYTDVQLQGMQRKWSQ